LIDIKSNENIVFIYADAVNSSFRWNWIWSRCYRIFIKNIWINLSIK
jgi:hypothetical protein